MKILVTGASGFIGQNTLAFLSGENAQNQLYAVVRNVPNTVDTNVKWIKSDLSKSGWTSALPNEHFDVIIHLAQSNHYRDFPRYSADIFNVNVGATVELAGWAVNHNVKRFLFASTGNVYGAKKTVHNENDYCHPETMYGASKLSAELLLKPFAEMMEILILRLFGVYGPGQKNAMLPGIIERFNQDQEITLAGDVGVEFNPLHINDCVAAINFLMCCPMNPAYEVLNIGGDVSINLKQVVNLLEGFGSKAAKLRITPDHPKQLVGSIEKAKNWYGFTPKVSINEGLRQTFDSL